MARLLYHIDKAYAGFAGNLTLTLSETKSALSRIILLYISSIFKDSDNSK